MFLAGVARVVCCWGIGVVAGVDCWEFELELCVLEVDFASELFVVIIDGSDWLEIGGKNVGEGFWK